MRERMETSINGKGDLERGLLGSGTTSEAQALICCSQLGQQQRQDLRMCGTLLLTLVILSTVGVLAYVSYMAIYQLPNDIDKQESSSDAQIAALQETIRSLQFHVTNLCIHIYGSAC